MNEKIQNRIEQRTGVPDLVQILSERLSGQDLQSLMLEVYHRRAQRCSPADVLRKYQSSRFAQPGACAPQVMLSVMSQALEMLAEDFEAVELSPLVPLGCCSVVATVHQNNVVSTSRNLEVAADPTNTLALECAQRRKKHDFVHLAATQRVVRSQHFGDDPNLYAHFALLGLCSAGRRSAQFELEALVRHLNSHLRFLRARFPKSELRVALTPLEPTDTFANLVCERVEAQGAVLELDPNRESGRGYYLKVCFKIYVDGLEVGDGGFTDWIRQLMADQKECLLISGLGLERIALL